jgi:ankyrin repeat protein
MKNVLQLLLIVLIGTTSVIADDENPAKAPREISPVQRAAKDQAFHDALVTAMHHFAEVGDLEHLKGILDKFPELVDARQSFRQPHKPSLTDSFTALHWAAREGREKVVAYLLKAGADVSALRAGGWTALHEAAHNGHLPAVEVLVAHGADVSAKTEAIPERVGWGPSADLTDATNPPPRFPAVPARTALDLANEQHHSYVSRFLKSQLPK